MQRYIAGFLRAMTPIIRSVSLIHPFGPNASLESGALLRQQSWRFLLHSVPKDTAGQRKFRPIHWIALNFFPIG